MARAERDLFGLCEEVVRVAIQDHLTDHLQRHKFFRYQLGGVENVKREARGCLFVEDLQTKLELWKITSGDRFPQIPTVEVRISSADLYSFIPQYRTRPQYRSPVELNEMSFSSLVYQPECVNSKSFHHSERSRYSPVGHDPHDHVHGFGHQGNEIPKRVVRGSSLRKSAVGFDLHGMNQVRELYGILDKKYGNIVADQVEVTLRCIELNREPSYVARQVGRSALACNGGKPDENWGFNRRIGKECRLGELFHRVVRLKKSVSASPAGMNDAFRCALVIEVCDLLAENEVFQKCRTSLARTQRVLIVRNRESLIGCEWRLREGRLLMGFAAVCLNLLQLGLPYLCLNRFLTLHCSIFLVREFFQKPELLLSKLRPSGGTKS